MAMMVVMMTIMMVIVVVMMTIMTVTVVVMMTIMMVTVVVIMTIMMVMKDACETVNAHLVEIESTEENDYLGGLIQSYGGTHTHTHTHYLCLCVFTRHLPCLCACHIAQPLVTPTYPPPHHSLVILG